MMDERELEAIERENEDGDVGASEIYALVAEVRRLKGEVAQFNGEATAAREECERLRAVVREVFGLASFCRSAIQCGERWSVEAQDHWDRVLAEASNAVFYPQEPTDAE